LQRKTSKGAATGRVGGRPTLDIPPDTSADRLIATINDRLRRTYQAAVDLREQSSSSGAGVAIAVGGAVKGTQGEVNFVAGNNVTISGAQNGGKVDVTLSAANPVIKVDKNGTLVGTRGELNLIEGSNVTLTVADNSGAGRVDVTIAASGGGGGSVALISEVITSSSQASVTFSAIANTWRDLLIVVRGRGDTAATTAQVQVQANGDTGNNYDCEVDNRFGQAASDAVASMRLGDLIAGSSPANFPGAVRIHVFNYRGTTFYKAFNSLNGVLTDTSGSMFTNRNTGWWRSTAAITSLKVFLSAGNFVDGSVVSLYGSM
jgi:hypothetical protein